MSSRRNMKRDKKRPQFVMLEYRMIDSPAFNDLGPSSIRVLLSIMRCKNGKNGTKEDPIVCPYSKMNGHMAKATISHGIQELEAKGFIELVSYGGLMKQPNQYILSGEWINWEERQNVSSETKPNKCRN